MLPLNHGGGKCQLLVRDPIPHANQLRAHSRIRNNPKITNFVESKLSTLQNISDLNMNKRGS